MQLAALLTSTRAGVLDGLAHVQRFHQGQFIGMGQQLVGKLDHDALARRRCHAAPAPVFKRRAARRHRGIDIGLAATRHAGEHAAIDRAKCSQRFGRRCACTRCAVDQGRPS